MNKVELTKIDGIESAISEYNTGKDELRKAEKIKLFAERKLAKAERRLLYYLTGIDAETCEYVIEKNGFLYKMVSGGVNEGHPADGYNPFIMGVRVNKITLDPIGNIPKGNYAAYAEKIYLNLGYTVYNIHDELDNKLNKALNRRLHQKKQKA